MAQDTLNKTTDRSRIKRLWLNYMAPQKGTLIIAFIFMIILAATQSAYVYFIRYVIDFASNLSGSENASTATQSFVKIIVPSLIVLTLISGLTMFAQTVLTNKVALNTVAGLQKDMAKSAHGADYAFFNQSTVGDLLSRFTNDMQAVTHALLRSLSNLLKDVMTILAVLTMMFWMAPKLSALILIVYPLAAWPIVRLSKTLRGNASAAQAHMGTLTSQLDESFSGARMVKTYGLEAHETQRLDKSFQERVRLYLKLVTNQARVDPLMEVFGGLAIAGIFAVGVYLVASGQSTGGTVAAILGAVLILAPRLRALGTLNNVVQEGLSALGRIYDVIDETPQITNRENAIELSNPQGDISLETVSFAYADEQVLDSVSLEAKPGETVALVGPSGGGKTTLFNLIPRLYDVQSGAVKIDGTDIKQLTLESLRRHIALVSQDVTLFNDSVAYNIGLGDKDATKDNIISAATAANAHDFITALPQGYDTIIGEDGDNLSGGQKQRLSIARALLRDAPILLLDEATSALDTESEAKVQAALSRLRAGRTTLVIAHRLSTIEQADRIYVLDKGRIIESGTHKALLKKKGLYAKLHAGFKA
ncbi:MAG: ABC transporter ATP-binding protein [Maricaulaceae bacterium]